MIVGLSPFTGRRRNRRVLGAIMAISLASLTACGGNDGQAGRSSAAPASAAVGKAAELVPAEFKNKTIDVAIGNDYPPYHYIDAGGKLVGVNPELAKALGEDMGLEFNLVPVGFDVIIAGLQSGRYHLSIPAFNITPARTKVLDFVTYVGDRSAYMSKSGSRTSINGPHDLCGLKVAVAKGTAQEEELSVLSGGCGPAGKPAIDIVTFTANSDASTAVLSGRVDAACATYSQLAYVSTTAKGQFTLAEYKGQSVPLAIGLPKGSSLGPAIEQAVKDLQNNGLYQQILERNNVKDLAYNDPKLVTGTVK